jgi:uncharacterized protein YigA (DUF484 family)
MAPKRSTGTSAAEQIAVLRKRVAKLDEERVELERRLKKVEEENKDFANQCVQAHEHSEAINNLYVASHRLHATLDAMEVMQIIKEILIELIGAEEFGILLLEKKKNALQLVAGESAEKRLPAELLPADSGVIGEVASSGEPFFFEPKTPAEKEAGLPLAAIPLQMNGTSVGVIVIYKLLSQKTGFSAVDHDLLQLLAAHAASALVSARLHGEMDRRLKTVEGFIQLMKSK